MSLTAATSPLPEYTNPPVVETVLGVQFDRLPGFTNAHLGAFWKTLDQAEWPKVADAPPLQLQFERFSEAAQWGRGLQLQLTPIPPGRVQIKNRAGDRMIQVQNGRLHFNWLGNDGNPYPRYEVIRTGFVDALERFQTFLSQANVGGFQANQWEVTYINHVSHGTVWTSPDEWTFFTPLSGVPTIEGVAQGEDFSGQWHFVMPEQRGRLHIEWQHALRAMPEQPEREIVQLTLTARGPLESKVNEIQPILSGLDLGRGTIVRAFAALMTGQANTHWGLVDASS